MERVINNIELLKFNLAEERDRKREKMVHIFNVLRTIIIISFIIFLAVVLIRQG